MRWLLIGMLNLSALVIVNVYSSTLTSFLTVRTYNPIINSLEEVPSRSDVRYLADMNGTLTNRLLVSRIEKCKLWTLEFMIV